MFLTSPWNLWALRNSPDLTPESGWNGVAEGRGQWEQTWGGAKGAQVLAAQACAQLGLLSYEGSRLPVFIQKLLYFGQQPGYRNYGINTPKQMRPRVFYLEKSDASLSPSTSRTVSLFGSRHSSVLWKWGETLLHALRRIQLKTLLQPLFIWDVTALWAQNDSETAKN